MDERAQREVQRIVRRWARSSHEEIRRLAASAKARGPVRIATELLQGSRLTWYRALDLAAKIGLRPRRGAREEIRCDARELVYHIDKLAQALRALELPDADETVRAAGREILAFLRSGGDLAELQVLALLAGELEPKR